MFFIIITKAKLYIIICCFIIACAALVYIIHITKVPALSIEAPPVDVVLDAGHGGFDGGAERGNIIEKDINLAITLKIRDLLAADGITVGMTRDSDVALGHTKRQDMYYRKDFVIASNPKVFVSIHENTYTDSQYSGAQVFYSKNNPLSQGFGVDVQNTLKTVNPQNIREAKKADGSVFLLKNLDMPAILVECGFISNPGEAVMLTEDSYQSKLAEAIKKGIEDELELLKTIPTPTIVPSTPVASVKPTS